MKTIKQLVWETRDTNSGGVPKFAWYLQRAVGGLVHGMTNGGIWNWENCLPIVDGNLARFITETPIISIVHGTWKEFALRNGSPPFTNGEIIEQQKQWNRNGVHCVAVSKASARQLLKHHNVVAEEIILNGIDTDVFIPQTHNNPKPVIIYAANDQNKGSHRMHEIHCILGEKLNSKFEFRYLNADRGEEHIKFAQGDLYCHPSNYEGNSYACLTPETPVITDRGIVNISNIRIGDKVLTHLGNFKKVLRIDNRHINEQIYNIKTQNNFNYLNITSEHPVLCWNTDLCVEYTKKSGNRYNKNKNNQWIQAKNLKVGNNLGMVENNYTYNKITGIKRTYYEGPVYNMEVEDDNSYVANNIIVHNCLEAMSCNLPIVGTACGLLEDINESDIGGIVPWDSESSVIADKIIEVYENRHLYNPREWVLKNATFEIFKQNWTNYLEKYL